MSFSENLNFLFRQSGLKNQKAFGHAIGIHQTQVSRLLRGTRTPTDSELLGIADYSGLDVEDLSLDENEFRRLYTQGRPGDALILHALQVVSGNLSKCREVFEAYKGQYILYNGSATLPYANASLLEIISCSKDGIRFSLINPYRDSNGSYTSFKYRGLMIPVDDFLYFFAEQIDQSYEILTMIFHASSAPKVTMLEGIQTGIGVSNDRKYIASAYAFCRKLNKPVSNYKAELGLMLGQLPLGKIPPSVQKKLSQSTRVSVLR